MIDAIRQLGGDSHSAPSVTGVSVFNAAGSPYTWRSNEARDGSRTSDLARMLQSSPYQLDYAPRGPRTRSTA